MYNQPWYNGIEEKEDVYIANKMCMLIGVPWMRQLRIKKSKSSVDKLVTLLPCFNKQRTLTFKTQPTPALYVLRQTTTDDDDRR